MILVSLPRGTMVENTQESCWWKMDNDAGESFLPFPSTSSGFSFSLLFLSFPFSVFKKELSIVFENDTRLQPEIFKKKEPPLPSSGHPLREQTP